MNTKTLAGQGLEKKSPGSSVREIKNHLITVHIQDKCRQLICYFIYVHHKALCWSSPHFMKMTLTVQKICRGTLNFTFLSFSNTALIMGFDQRSFSLLIFTEPDLMVYSVFSVQNFGERGAEEAVHLPSCSCRGLPFALSRDWPAMDRTSDWLHPVPRKLSFKALPDSTCVFLLSIGSVSFVCLLPQKQ